MFLEAQPIKAKAAMFFICLIAALALTFVARRKNLFKLTPTTALLPDKKVLLSIFGIYFFINFFLLSIFFLFFKYRLIVPEQLAVVGNVAAILLIFGSYCLYFLNKKKTLLSIFKPGISTFNFKCIWYYFLMALASVYTVIFFVELISLALFNISELPDQTVVYLLKKLLPSPLYFTLASLMIIFLGPALEEFLFRGVLQNWLKNFLSVKKAIFFSSLIFVVFHFSALQGIANINIAISLFVLSFYIGLIYEKQQNLFAPIILHSLFNAFNILNLLFL